MNKWIENRSNMQYFNLAKVICISTDEYSKDSFRIALRFEDGVNRFLTYTDSVKRDYHFQFIKDFLNQNDLSFLTLETE